eukprot:1135880-Amphidinium_carterae.2
MQREREPEREIYTLALSTWLSALHQSGAGMSGLLWTSRLGRKSHFPSVPRSAESSLLELVEEGRLHGSTAIMALPRAIEIGGARSTTMPHRCAQQRDCMPCSR